MNSRIQAALANATKVRSMFKSYVEDLTPEQWYWQPEPGMNHVAWQVGHIAVSQHALCLKRVRGDSPDDAQALPEDFYKRFGRGSEPVPGADQNPGPDTLVGALDSVFQMVERELSQKSDAELDQPMSKPHPMFDTVLGGVEFSPQHEMLHVGQVILLRRLMGIEPKW